MCNRPLEMMVNRIALPTEKHDASLVDEDETRPRVLLVESSGWLYAVAVTNVREVVHARAITRVPGAPPTMLGLVNVRGMVVTVLNLDACVRASNGKMTRAAGPVTESRAVSGTSIVLIEHGNRVVGLSVASVRDVRVLDDAGGSTHVPMGLAGEFLPKTVQSFGSAGGETVVLLDVAEVLTRHLISSSET